MAAREGSKSGTTFALNAIPLPYHLKKIILPLKSVLMVMKIITFSFSKSFPLECFKAIKKTLWGSSLLILQPVVKVCQDPDLKEAHTRKYPEKHQIYP